MYFDKNFIKTFNNSNIFIYTCRISLCFFNPFNFFHWVSVLQFFYRNSSLALMNLFLDILLFWYPEWAYFLYSFLTNFSIHVQMTAELFHCCWGFFLYTSILLNLFIWYKWLFDGPFLFFDTWKCNLKNRV